MKEEVVISIFGPVQHLTRGATRGAARGAAIGRRLLAIKRQVHLAVHNHSEADLFLQNYLLIETRN